MQDLESPTPSVVDRPSAGTTRQTPDEPTPQYPDDDATRSAAVPPRHRRRHRSERTRRRRGRVTPDLLNALLFVIGAFLIGSIGFRSRAVTTNIDGVSYMSIAQQYAAGQLSEAVNAYWSPLVSWLMAPIIAAGLESTAAFMVVNVATCLSVLVVQYLLVRRVIGSSWVAFWVQVVTIPMLMNNVGRDTPDILVVLWFLGFVWALTAADAVWTGSRRQRVRAGVVLGVVCALGYFAKLYVIPVFVVVLPIWFLVRFIRTERAGRSWSLLLTPAATVAALVVVAAPWIAAQSVKYDTVMIGSSFGVNISGKFDTSDGGGSSRPYSIPAPPNDRAVSAPEDRTSSVYEANTRTASRTTSGSDGSAPGTDADPQTVGDRLWYYVSQRYAAFPYYLSRIGSFAAFVVPIGVLFVAGTVTGRIRFRRHPFAHITAITTGVYMLGYAAITTVATQGGNARYYLPLMTGTLLMAAALLPSVWSSVRGGVRRSLVVLGCVVVAFASFSQNVLVEAAPFSTVRRVPAGAALLDVFGPTDRPTDAVLVEQLRATDTIGPGSDILASNYRKSVSIAFALDAQAYGRSGEDYSIGDPSFVRLVQDSGIDYFLDFTPVDSPSRDSSLVGPVVASVEATTTCSDEKGARAEPCRIDVIRVD